MSEFDLSQFQPDSTDNNPWIIPPEVQAQRDAIAAKMKEEEKLRPELEGGVGPIDERLAAREPVKTGGFDLTKFVPDKQDAFDPSQFKPDSPSTQPDTIVGQSPEDTGPSISAGAKEYLAMPGIPNQLVGHLKEVTGEVGKELGDLRKQGISTVPELAGMAVGAAAGSADFLGSTLERFGGLLNGSAVTYATQYVQEHPDASPAQIMLALLQSPTLSSQAVKAIKDQLPKSPSMEFGEKLIGAPFTIPTQAIARTVTGATGSEVLGGIAGELTNLGMMAAPFSKGKVKTDLGPGPGPKATEPSFVGRAATEKADKASGTPPDVGVEPYTPDLLQGMGEEQLRQQTPFGKTEGLPKDENGIPYNPELSGDVQQAQFKPGEGQLGLFEQQPEKVGPEPQTGEQAKASFTKSIEEDMAYFQHETGGEHTAMSLAFEKALGGGTVHSNPFLNGDLVDRRIVEALKRLRGESDNTLEFLRKAIEDKIRPYEFDQPEVVDHYVQALNQIMGEQTRREVDTLQEKNKGLASTLTNEFKAGQSVLLNREGEQGRYTIVRELAPVSGGKVQWIVEKNGARMVVSRDEIRGKAGGFSTVNSNPFADPELYSGLYRFIRGNEKSTFNADGSPKHWFHATVAGDKTANVPFEIPWTDRSEMGFHVGGVAQARNRYKTTGGVDLHAPEDIRIMDLHISSKNAYQMKDTGSFDWKNVGAQLVKDKLVPYSKFKEILDEFNAPDNTKHYVDKDIAATTAVQKLLKNAGYDSIKYMNRYEGIDMDTFSMSHLPAKTIDALIEKYKEELMYNKFGPETQGAGRALGDVIRKHGTDEEFQMLFPEAGEARILFDPEQVKSAQFNNGDYSSMQKSILRSISPEILLNPKNKDFWSKMILGNSRPDIRYDLLPGLIEKFGKPETWGDSTALIGMSTASHRAKNALIWALSKKSDKIPTLTLETAVDNHMQYLLGEKHAIDMSVDPVFKKIAEIYGTTTIPKGRAKLADFAKDIRVLLDMEADNSTWFDGTKYYWTKDQLVAHGIPEERAVHLEALGKVLDSMWGILDEANRIKGGKPIQRIPGYLPHSISGPYRAIVELVDADGNSTGHFLNMGAYTRKQAKAMLDYAEKELANHPDRASMSFKLEDPSSEGYSVAGLTEGLLAASAVVGKNKALGSLIKKIYQGTEQGIIREALERQKTPMLGHDLQRATEFGKDNPLALTPKQQARAVLGLRKAFEDVTGYNMRVKFVNGVIFPLFDNGFLTSDKFSGFAQNIKTRTNAFLKINDVLEQSINNRIKGILVSYGMNPGLLGQFSRGIMSWTSKLLLWANPRFWAANFWQSTYLAGMMQTYKALGMAVGESTGSITKAVADSQKDLKAVPLMERGKSAILDYAMDHGYTDFAYTEMVDPSTIKDRISMGLEQRTRAISFIGTYHYFKQFMTHQEALEAAGAKANQIGVSYNTQFGGPTWFNQMQFVERPLALFQTFTAHQFGMLNQQIGVAALAMRRGDLSHAAGKSFVQALSGIATFQAMQYAIFGMSGLYFATSIDQVIKLINQLAGWDIPTSQDMARKFDSMMPEGLKGINTFGAMSKYSGWDIGTSGQGLNVRVPDVVPKTLLTLKDWAVLGMRWAGVKAGISKKQVTAQEVKEAVDESPASIRELMMFALKHDGYSDLPKVLTGQKSDWSPEPNVAIEQGRQRSYVESLMALSLGIQSIEEKSFQQTEQITERKKKVLDETFNSIIQKAKEHKQISSEDMSNLMWSIYTSGKDPSAVIDAIIGAQIEKNFDPDTRRALEGISSIEAYKKYEQYLQQRALTLQPQPH